MEFCSIILLSLLLDVHGFRKAAHEGSEQKMLSDTLEDAAHNSQIVALSGGSVAEFTSYQAARVDEILSKVQYSCSDNSPYFEGYVKKEVTAWIGAVLSEHSSHYGENPLDRMAKNIMDKYLHERSSIYHVALVGWGQQGFGFKKIDLTSARGCIVSDIPEAHGGKGSPLVFTFLLNAKAFPFASYKKDLSPYVSSSLLSSRGNAQDDAHDVETVASSEGSLANSTSYQAAQLDTILSKVQYSCSDKSNYFEGYVKKEVTAWIGAVHTEATSQYGRNPLSHMAETIKNKYYDEKGWQYHLVSAAWGMQGVGAYFGHTGLNFTKRRLCEVSGLPDTHGGKGLPLVFDLRFSELSLRGVTIDYPKQYVPSNQISKDFPHESLDNGDPF